MKLLKYVLITSITCFSLNVFSASVWKVSNGKNHLYIGGTIHILAAEDYPLPKEYNLAYAGSEKIVFETDMVAVNSAEFGQKVMQEMTYSDDTTLDKVLNLETYTAVTKHLKDRGMPIQPFVKFKPSLLSITLSVMELQAIGLTSEGVDKYFSDMAVKDNKQQSWLESPEQQISFLKNMGGEDENAMIEYTLKDIKRLPTMIGGLRSSWRTGDMPALADIGITEFKADYPQIYQDLLVTRNNDWIPKIETMLDSAPTEFILVGVLHLAGADSVLQKLTAKGYSIKKL